MGNFIARKGAEVEYMGKKYISLRELSRELDIPYSPLAHRYYRKIDIEESVAWAEKSKKKNKLYILWGRNYKSINEIALYFGLNPDPIRVRSNEKLSLEEAISELLKKEIIQYEGKEFQGITELTIAYGHEASLIFDRLTHGFSLKRAVQQPILKKNSILETLQAIQKETKECYVVDGKARTYNELLQTGYPSSSYKKVPKQIYFYYPQLQGHDFTKVCIDAAKIHEEVKEEKLSEQKVIKKGMTIQQ